MRLYSIPPDLSYLKAFGCLCFVSTSSSTQRNKFDPRATTCTFLGYHAGHKAYKVLDMKTKQIFISRDWVFHEQHFPIDFQNTSTNDSTPPIILLPTYTEMNPKDLPDMPQLPQ